MLAVCSVVRARKWTRSIRVNGKTPGEKVCSHIRRRTIDGLQAVELMQGMKLPKPSGRESSVQIPMRLEPLSTASSLKARPMWIGVSLVGRFSGLYRHLLGPLAREPPWSGLPADDAPATPLHFVQPLVGPLSRDCAWRLNAATSKATSPLQRTASPSLGLEENKGGGIVFSG